MNYFKKFLLSFTVFAVTSLIFFSPFFANAQTSQESTRCSKFAAYFSFGDQNVVEGLPKYCSVSQLLATVLQILLYLSGVVTVLFIILGGFFYLTAAGNDEQLEKGKKILINAVIGLIVIIMATAIVKIVSGTLQKGSGSSTGVLVSHWI